MSSHGAFPPQIVNLVIDQLGDAYQNYPKYSPHRDGTYKALRACVLVSKKWAGRSRAHLFSKVKVEVSKGRPTPTPPASILPYIKHLGVQCDRRHDKAPLPAGLLKALSAAPVEHLAVNGGELTTQRVCIQEFIDAHSATLQTVEFEDCSISAHNIVDIVSGRHGLKRLTIDHCNCEPLPSARKLAIADPGTGSKAAELELSISGGDPEEGPMDIAFIVARLPHRFSRLDVEHVVAGDGTTEATNALIKANAHVLSSLRVHLLAEDMEVDVEPEHLFSLKGCSNLSELTLDMERSESRALCDSASIFSTLIPKQSIHLGKITLEAPYVSRWFNKDGPVEDKEDEEDEDEGGSDDEGNPNRKERWEGLDAVLSDLAKASISGRNKRLTFTLVVLQRGDNHKLMPVVRKWLPKLLPRFNKLGLLHAHYTRDSHCRAVDDSCLRHDKPGCLAEDFKDSY